MLWTFLQFGTHLHNLGKSILWTVWFYFTKYGHIMYKILLIFLPTTSFRLTSLIQPWTMSAVIASKSSLTWPNDVRGFWRSFRLDMAFDVSNIFESLLYCTKSMKWDIVHEDKPLSLKARNDLGMNEFEGLVCIVGTKYDIVCNDSFMTNYNHQR
jgi:hypothetical protein